jgi:hypothetical protein
MPKDVQIPVELLATIKAENVQKELERNMGTAVRKTDALHSKLLASTMLKAHKNRMKQLDGESAKLRKMANEIDQLRMKNRGQMSMEEKRAHLHQMQQAKIRHKEQLKQVEDLAAKKKAEDRAAMEASEMLIEKKQAMGAGAKRGVEYLGGGAGAGAVQAFEGAAEMGKAMKGVTAGMGKMAAAATVAAGAFAAIGGLVAAFMAIESHAKGMNKELLGIGGFNMAGPVRGMEKFGDASSLAMARLHQLRDYASDIRRNIQLGMTEDEWAGVVNEMQDANIALDDMMRTIPEVNAEFGKSANLLAINVIAAKTLGVSTGEVAQAMGSWLKDGNLSMGTMLDSLGQVAQDAQESGIDVRKFFGVVTQTTAELGLFGGRIEEISSAFKILTKRMGEKEAQKALQAMTGFLDQNNDEQRLKLTLMAGEGRARKALQNSAKRQFMEMKGVNERNSELAKAMGVTNVGLKEYGEIVKMNRGEFNKFTADLARKGVDDKVIRDMMKVYDQGTAKGAARVSTALAQADLTAQMEVAFTGIERMFGPIQNLTGINAMAAKQALGMSTEQLEQMRQFDNTVQTRVGALTKILHDDNLNVFERQNEIRDFLEKNGITSQEDQAKVMEKLESGETSTAAYLDDLLNSTEKEGMKTLSQAKTLAEKQAEATTTMADKLGQIAGFLMTKMWNGFVKWFGSDEDKAALAALEKESAAQTEIDRKNLEAQQAANESAKSLAKGEAKLAEDQKAEAQKIKDAIVEGTMTNKEGEAALRQIEVGIKEKGFAGAAEKGFTEADISRMMVQIEARKGAGEKFEDSSVRDLAIDELIMSQARERKKARQIGRGVGVAEAAGMDPSTEQLQKIGEGQEEFLKLLEPGMDAAQREEKASEGIEKALTDSGIEIAPDAIKKLASEMAKAQALSEARGILGEDFEAVMSGKLTDLSGVKGMTAEKFEAVTSALGAVGMKTGSLTGPGLAEVQPGPTPPDDLQLTTDGWVKGSAGDMLVMANELGGGRAGPAGALAGKAGGPGGGSTFNITFIGTPKEMENRMRQIILEHDRRTS